MPEKVSKKLLVWGKDNIDPNAIKQAQRASELPFVVGHLALMPDAHWGMGATIGSVIPTKGAIIPAAVGVDIGCGMIAVKTNLTSHDLPDNLGWLLADIGMRVPAGVGKGHDVEWTIAPNLSVSSLGLAKRAGQQIGSLGSGNHFIEVGLNPNDSVWVVLHSGSRGVGNKLAMHHICIAKGLMKEYFIELDDVNLAYLVQGTPQFNDYITDLRWAQDYAFTNREVMMDQVLTALYRAVYKQEGRLVESERINCHHNYTVQENHNGSNLWITRKGAIRAREGDLGVIPGSMGTSTFIVRGLGHPGSYNSSAHGAGRTMSRTQAKKELTVDSLKEAMAGKSWNEKNSGRLLDEHPKAYKDIHSVMRDQADLVEVVTEITQILNYKGS